MPIIMHPWTAELVTRNTPGDLRAEHERALAMRLRRFDQRRAAMTDLADIPCHLAALGRYDEIADIASQAVRMLPGTLATVAYLAEIRPLIPPAERAWALVAELEVQALLRAGDLRSATRQLHAIHEQVQARAAADPANTEWQRDLSVTHDKLGDVAVGGRGPGRGPGRLPGRPGHRGPAGRRRSRQHRMAARPVHQPRRLGDVAIAAGDLAAARAAYQAGLDIAARLAAADPANTEWQRDLSVSHNQLGDVAIAAGDLAAARAAYQAGLDIRTGWPPPTPPTPNGSATCPSATTSWGTWRWRPGTWPRPAPPTRPPWTSRTRLAAADPANTEWQRDLSISHNKLGDVAIAAGDLAAARAAYQASLDIADPAGRRRSRQHRMAARPVHQPQQAGGRGDRGRGPGRRPGRLPGRPGHRGPAGRRRPGQHRMAARPVHQPRPAGGRGDGGRGPGRGPGRLPGRPGHRGPAGRRRPRQHRMAARPVHQPRRLGDVAAAAGDLAAARAAYQAGLDIAARLAAADPANTEWQRDLSISHNKLGDLAVDAGDLAAARAAYQAGLDIAARLAAADPVNTGWQRDLERAQQKISDLDG